MSVPLSARLDAIPSLAEVARASLPLGMNAVFMTPEGVLGIARPPRPSRLNFFAEGLPFHVAVSPDERDGAEGAVCQIWAEVGHIPYSAQSPQRRRRLLDALRAIQAAPVPGGRARFLVQEGTKILLFSETRVEGHVTPEALFHDIVLLIQEARPYLRVLGDYV